MNIAQLVNALSEIASENTEVVIDDADTRAVDDEPGWLLAIKRVRFIDGRVVLSGDYHDSDNPA